MARGRKARDDASAAAGRRWFVPVQSPCRFAAAHRPRGPASVATNLPEPRRARRPAAAGPEGSTMIDRAAKLLFLLGVCAVLVLGGLYIGWKRLPPVAQVEEAAEAIRDWRTNWK